MAQGERPGGAGIPDTALCPPLPPSGPLPLSPGDGSLPSTLAVEVGQFGNRVAGGAPGCLSSSSSVTSTGPAPPSLGAPPRGGGCFLPATRISGPLVARPVLSSCPSLPTPRTLQLTKETGPSAPSFQSASRSGIWKSWTRKHRACPAGPRSLMLSAASSLGPQGEPPL